MSKNLGFARRFIILKKQYSNMRELNPKGHGKLELRGSKLNISLNIENVEKNSFYNVILVRKGKSFDLGKIFTEDNYIGRANFNLNRKDLEDMDFPIDRINGILIVRDTNVLLGGYFNKGDNSIEDYIEELKIQKLEEAEVVGVEFEEEIEEFEAEESVEELPGYVEEIVATEETQVEEEFILEEPETQEPPVEKTEEFQVGKSAGESEVEEVIIEEDVADEPIAYEIGTEDEYDKAMSTIFHEDLEEETEEVYIPPSVESHHSTIPEEPKDYYDGLERGKKLNQQNQTTNYVLNILSFFPYIEPLRTNLQGYNWWKIDIDDPQGDKGFLPYFSYITGGNHRYPIIKNTVTANDLMRRYGHYLFGLYNVKDQVKFYVYGVPGKFTVEDHPQKGTTGFNTWFEGEEDDGYWLLYIDPISGRIIHPINPMIPVG